MARESTAATVARYVGALNAKRPFTSAKINHGFWEMVARADLLQRTGLTDTAEIEQKLGRQGLFTSGYFDELIELFASLPAARDKLDFGASPYAFPACRRINGTPSMGLALTKAVIDRFVPAGAINQDGLLWKQATYDGSIARVFRALREREVTLIGPPWLENFGAFARLDRFRHLPIHPTAAHDNRFSFFESVVHSHVPGTVYLIQAGSYSIWLALRLHAVLERATLIDFGLVLDICYLPQITKQAWALVARSKVAATIVAINGAWPEDARFFAPDTPPNSRAPLWRRFRDGIMPRIGATAGIAPRAPHAGDLDTPKLESSAVQFIEDKRIDMRRIDEILALSRKANHWANFGPVANALESVLASTLRLPKTRACVVCASATTALFALAGIHAAKAGRPLRWVTSAFGFLSLSVGPFAGTLTYVDCGPDGFIDLDAVARLPDGAWDGLIVTNIFGHKSDLEVYRQFARERNKSLIVDGATALWSVDRSTHGDMDEAISFHQTKAWGVGEGGLAIVAPEDVPLFRTLVNFGVGAPDFARPYALNGKISDIAAAAILERMERMPSWQFFYRAQWQRIRHIAEFCGAALLGKVPPSATAANVAVLAPRPVASEDFAKERFTVRKYYRPLAPNMPVAERIFAHIINVPCHPGMAAVPTQELERFFSSLAASRPKWLSGSTP